jgi:hypothetical protein
MCLNEVKRFELKPDLSSLSLGKKEGWYLGVDGVGGDDSTCQVSGIGLLLKACRAFLQQALENRTACIPFIQIRIQPLYNTECHLQYTFTTTSLLNSTVFNSLYVSINTL